ncbi:hypothetical protein BGZ91_006692, partial [Linnemannia elongata]
AKQFSSPTPGTFIIALHYKSRDKAILEMDLKQDNLLEKKSQQQPKQQQQQEAQKGALACKDF